MNEAYVIRTITDYMDECLNSSVIYWNDNSFKSLSYSRWAVDEILDRIIDELSKLPPHITGIEPKSHIEIIKEFIDEMGYLSEQSQSKEEQLIFSSAECTGIEILYLFL